MSAKTKLVFAIGFIGLVGSGKSFLAKKLSEKLNLYVASNDQIRRFLNDFGVEGESPRQELIQKIAEDRTCYLYKKKISHIIDADLMLFYKRAIKFAQDYGVKFYLIHVICPEEIIIKRLEKRKRNDSIESFENLSKAGVKRYFIRKQISLKKTLPEFFYTIDTSLDVDAQIDKLISKLNKENIL